MRIAFMINAAILFPGGLVVFTLFMVGALMQGVFGLACLWLKKMATIPKEVFEFAHGTYRLSYDRYVTKMMVRDLAMKGEK